MTADEMHRLLAAPEILLVDVVDAALDSLSRGLVLEHPALDDPDGREDPPVCRRARSALFYAHRLRAALATYRHAVDDALRRPPDDLPF